MTHFLNTWTQILNYDGGHRLRALRKWLEWQGRRVLGAFPTKAQIFGSSVYIDRPSGVHALCYFFGAYDYNNMRLIRRVLDDCGGGAVFFDVGANVGVYTLIASEIGATRVISFEPSPGTAERLRINLKINLRSNVTLIQAAVSDRCGTLPFYVHGDDAVSRVANEREIENSGTVQCCTLDSVCEEMGLIPTMVKIDIEGHEPAALAGFMKNLAATPILLVEDGERDEVVKLMHASGLLGPYWCHARLNSLRKCPQKRVEDAIFINVEGQSLLASLGFTFAD